MIETEGLGMFIELLDEKINTLVGLKNSLICKKNDLEQRLGEGQTEEPVLVKPDFERVRIVESLAYDIIGNKNRKFLDGLLAFMGAYGL